MEARERESTARVARGAQPLDLHPQWVGRPRLSSPEQVLFNEFLRFARFCGGDPRPQDALAWFEMRSVPKAEQEWMCVVFAAMAEVVREREPDDR